MRIPPNERIVGGRIGVDRHREDVLPLVKDALRAVAVVHVDIEDRNALMLQPKVASCHRAVVEEAEAAGHVGIGVVARRTAQRVGRILAVHDQVHRERLDRCHGQRRRLAHRPVRWRSC